MSAALSSVKSRAKLGVSSLVESSCTAILAIGPTVELVLDTGHHANGNGHAAVEVNGNGHSDEVPEPQQSLFSWAEFMAEEPVKPKGRGRKPQPAATSLFEWALEMEQEREEEPVGAGR